MDHVIEVGGPSTLTKAVRSVCSGGWIHIIGYIGGVRTLLPIHY